MSPRRVFWIFFSGKVPEKKSKKRGAATLLCIADIVTRIISRPVPSTCAPIRPVLAGPVTQLSGTHTQSFEIILPYDILVKSALSKSVFSHVSVGGMFHLQAFAIFAHICPYTRRGEQPSPYLRATNIRKLRVVGSDACHRSGLPFEALLQERVAPPVRKAAFPSFILGHIFIILNLFGVIFGDILKRKKTKIILFYTPCSLRSLSNSSKSRLSYCSAFRTQLVPKLAPKPAAGAIWRALRAKLHWAILGLQFWRRLWH